MKTKAFVPQPTYCGPRWLGRLFTWRFSRHGNRWELEHGGKRAWRRLIGWWGDELRVGRFAFAGPSSRRYWRTTHRLGWLYWGRY